MLHCTSCDEKLRHERPKLDRSKTYYATEVLFYLTILSLSEPKKKLIRIFEVFEDYNEPVAHSIEIIFIPWNISELYVIY